MMNRSYTNYKKFNGLICFKLNDWFNGLMVKMRDPLKDVELNLKLETLVEGVATVWDGKGV